jgi:adenosylcobyric acid synthase
VTEIVMVMGTGAGSGKSVLTVGLCRALAAVGRAVLPFKAVSVAKVGATDPGDGIAHHVRAARVPFHPMLNPVVVLPGPEVGRGRLLIGGRPYGTARYANEDVLVWTDLPTGTRTAIREEVRGAWQAITDRAELVVVEGAASPAELDDGDDIANLYTARLTGAPVVLCAQFSRGGAASAVIGTAACLPLDIHAQVRGFVFSNVVDHDLEAVAAARVRRHCGLPQVGRIRHISLWEGPPQTHPSDEAAYGVWANEVSRGCDLTPLMARPTQIIRAV